MDVRVGLIGYGYAGKVLHAPLIRAVPGLKLTTVASSKPDEVRADLGPNVRVCSPAELMQADLDVVIVVTPNTEHFPLATAAMKAGKDVVVDKPFTLNLAEARQLADFARNNKRMLTVFQNRRWDSEVRSVMDALTQGLVGRVVQFDCRMHRYRPNVRKRWREEPGPGAGLWFDLGPHLIDLTIHLFGYPQAITADLAILREGGVTDDWGHAVLTYPDMRVTLEASLLDAGALPRSVLYGTEGTWAKYGADVQETQLQEKMSPLNPAFGVDASKTIFYGGDGSTVELNSVAGNQLGFYSAVRDAIVNGTEPPVSLDDALAVMTILDASFQSAREKRTLPLNFSTE
jgi:predicted dehydrogenase